MNAPNSRRTFLGTAACAGGCALLGALAKGADGEGQAPPKKSYDFDKLTYCCFACKPEQCPLLKASLNNDPEGKKQTAAEWREKYKREFKPEEVFCFGCKVEPVRLGFNVKNCDVRACVIGKGLVSCAHCRELATCQKALWVNYPKFREHVLGVQKDVLG
jgi:hypothetical protein